MNKNLNTIGKLAEAVNVNVQTIRYYERLGLLMPAGRKESYRQSGYRLYDKLSLKRLLFIRHARELGFTLEEIKELLNLSVSPTAKCGDIRKKAEERLLDINKKIDGLVSMRTILEKLVKNCANRKATEECPILKAIEGDGWKV